MQIFTFQSETDPASYGFTASQVDHNLPSVMGPWRLLEGSIDVAGIGNTDVILDAVKANGWCVAKVEAVKVARSSVLYHSH